MPAACATAFVALTVATTPTGARVVDVMGSAEEFVLTVADPYEFERVEREEGEPTCEREIWPGVVVEQTRGGAVLSVYVPGVGVDCPRVGLHEGLVSVAWGEPVPNTETTLVDAKGMLVTHTADGRPVGFRVPLYERRGRR